MNDKKSNSTIQIVVAIIGATAICIAAIIGIMQPIVSRLVDNNFPTNTPLAYGNAISETPIYIVVTETALPIIPTKIITNTPIETQEKQIATPTGIPTSEEDKSTFATLVGVNDSTAFSTTDAMNYSYMANVDSLEKAISELEKVFDQNDIVYVVHVPNLRITPGNPGSCKLYLEQISQLNEYPLGRVIKIAHI